MIPRLAATAVAHSNIALIKYWGKLPKSGNYPAVPSLSLTLDSLCTRTHVSFDSKFGQDEFELDGTWRGDRSLERVSNLLSAVRSLAGLPYFAKVVSSNNFPTASGLASSASGFAALALAATHAAGLVLEPTAVSAIARACSASSARSIFGGWVSLGAGADSALAIDSGEGWDVVLVVAVTDPGPKALGSTQAMMLSSATSPYYSAWVQTAPALFANACKALRERDLDSLGQCMEESTWRMHATMLTSVPAVVYLSPVTLAIINEIRNRRSTSVPAYFTTDAGPHVKVLTTAEHAIAVKGWLIQLPGVTNVIICRTGSCRLRRTAFRGKSHVVKARAPGKVVLSGAYAVLDGAPALVSAVDRYVIADARRPAQFITEEVRAAALWHVPWFDAGDLRTQDRKLGLGSSAAILVASLAADQLHRSGPLDDETLVERVLPLALNAHALVQPLGSGIDVVASCYGGTQIVQKIGDALIHDRVQLPANLYIEVWAAPNSCRTHEMLSALVEYRREHPRQYSELISQPSLASEQAATAARFGDAKSFVTALAAQRFVLQALGQDTRLNIVTSEVSALADLAAEESAAVLPAGAGGGDIAIFAGLQPPSGRLRTLMASQNHDSIGVSLGARGVHGVGAECYQDP